MSRGALNLPDPPRRRPSNHDPLLTVRGAAGVLGVHPNTVRAWTDQGRLTCLRINRRGDRRYRLEDMERFLAGARQRESVAAAATPVRRATSQPRLGSAGRAVLVLRDIARLGAESDGLDELLPHAATLISTVFGYSAAAFVAPDGTRRPLLGVLVPDRRLIKNTVHGQAVLRRGDRRAPGAATLAVGLGSAGRPAGILLFHRSSAPLVPSELEIELLSALGAELGAVGEAHRRRAVVDERRRRVERLLAVSSDIASELNLPRVLEQLVDYAMELFGADHACIFRRRPDGGYAPEVSRNLSPDFAESVAHAPTLPLAAHALETGRIISAADYPDDPRAALRPALLREGINTVTIAPLASDGLPLGVLALYHDQRYEWSAEDLELLGRLAAQGSSVMRSAQNYSQMATWAAHLQSIQQLGSRLTRLGTVREIGQAIAAELNQLIDYHNVRVYRVAGDDCVPVAWQGQVGEYQGEDGEQLRLKVGEGITGWVARHGLAQNLGDAAKDRRSKTMPGTDDGLDESLLLAPMLYEDQVIGVIVLAKLGLHQFGSDHLRLLEIYAAIAAQAMANADATERLQAQSEALERQLQSQRELLRVTESLLSTLDTQTLLEEIAERFKTLVQVDSIAVDVHDERAGLLRPIFASGIHAQEYLAATIPDTQGVGGYVVRTGEPQLVQDELNDPRVAHFASLGPVPGAMIVAPLRSGDRVQGLLTIERLGSEARFSDEEFDLVKLFAAHASIALQNAERHRAVELRAETDPLTGLKNHGALNDHLARAVEHDGSFALLMIDLDDFKLYNDQRGHQAGSLMLQRLAAILRTSCRDADEIFRYGGDEFAILLPSTSLQGALTVAGLVGAAVRAASNGGEQEPVITCSIGVAEYPRDGHDVASIILAADRACYAAKRGGRDRTATTAEGLALEPEFQPVTTPVDKPEIVYPAA